MLLLYGFSNNQCLSCGNPRLPAIAQILQHSHHESVLWHVLLTVISLATCALMSHYLMELVYLLYSQVLSLIMCLVGAMNLQRSMISQFVIGFGQFLLSHYQIVGCGIRSGVYHGFVFDESYALNTDQGFCHLGCHWYQLCVSFIFRLFRLCIELKRPSF